MSSKPDFPQTLMNQCFVFRSIFPLFFTSSGPCLCGPYPHSYKQCPSHFISHSTPKILTFPCPRIFLLSLFPPHTIGPSMFLFFNNVYEILKHTFYLYCLLTYPVYVHFFKPPRSCEKRIFHYILH